MRAAPKTVGALALLTALLPLNLALTAVALLRSLVVPPRRGDAAEPLTILVSGGKMTKALALTRAFHRAGHRVVLVESRKYALTGHRFSRSVDRFHTVPEPEAPDYAQALLDLVRREGVDVYVPVSSPAASRFDAEARALLDGHCTVVHADAGTVAALDDKHAFSALAASLGLAVPRCHRITSPQQVADFDFAADGGTYILKSIPYDPIRRMDLTRLPLPTRAETAAFAAALPISEATPWIMQEFVEGQEFCTHSTVREGTVQLHCCCASSAFQINYAMVDRPDIEAWVTRFVGALGVTGQLSFDFIEAADGRVFAIECNPRTHSAITMFYDDPRVAPAYLEAGGAAIVPATTGRPTFWLYHELWRLLRRPSTAALRLRTISRGKDAIFDWADPLPFLMVHHAQIPWLLLQSLRRGTSWARIDFNIGKLVEPAGD